MKKIKSLLWSIMGVGCAVGFACLGAIASLSYIGWALEDFRQFRDN